MSVPDPRPVGAFEGQPVHEIALTGPDGMEARILTWGAVIRDLTLPSLDGVRQSVVLGFDRFEDYPAHSPYFGALVGRVANRIANGRFGIAGRMVTLAQNEGLITLHGGPGGFAHRVWTILARSADAVTLGLVSPDGDQGFPGRVDARCTYRLTKGLTLEVKVQATTDAPTPVNLAQHSYWNLDGSSDISDHHLTVHADRYTPVGPGDIPTGEVAPVAGTPFDLRHGARMGDIGHLLDINYALTRHGEALFPAAEVRSRSGLRLRVATTKPGLQVYDGHKIDIGIAGTGGRRFKPGAGLCLETQFYPDSPNHPGFPDTILRPGQTYAHETTYAFDRPDP